MFYVLASHNTYALERQFKTLPKQETTVIINTLDKDFEKFAQEYCWKEKIRCITTESDGSAATGKNKFLEIFEDDNVPYAVLVDGDDYLTPRGVKVYKELASRDTPPDVVCITNQVTISWPEGKEYSYLDNRDENADPSTLPQTFYVGGSTVVDWDELHKGELITDSYPNYDPRVLEEWQKYIENIRFGMGVDEIASRVVFMSRKVIPYKFKEFVVGEDTVQFLELKDAFEKGKLTFVALKEDPHPTYIYDLRLSGIAVNESKKDESTGYLVWVTKLGRYIQALKQAGKLHSTRIPVLEI